MCSIFGILDIKEHPESLRRTALEMSRRQLHRGPDWEGIYQGEKAIIVHERLSIVDPSNGAQPLYNDNHTHVLAANGEIYNHKQLKSELTIPYNFKTGSDCEVILALYEEFKQTGKPFFSDFFCRNEESCREKTENGLCRPESKPPAKPVACTCPIRA